MQIVYNFNEVEETKVADPEVRRRLEALTEVIVYQKIIEDCTQKLKAIEPLAGEGAVEFLKLKYGEESFNKTIAKLEKGKVRAEKIQAKAVKLVSKVAETE